jgi:phosphatidylserine/phosphatidylglycerophosphate/cardiolipin synthase-like enzyme
MNARGDAGIGVKEKGKRKFGYYETVSSVSMLFPLQWKYGERVKVSYYHTPKLHGMWKTVLPERVNELVGVQHSKFYLFDNDILISGANLSEQYFTNRQDRYIWIRQNPAVAQFYHSFLKTVSRFSFSLHPESGILAFPEDMPDPSKNPSLFNQTAKNAFSDLLASHLPPHPHLPAPHHFKESSTWVFPTIQLGHAGVRHDEALTLKFLSHVPSSLKQPQNQLTSNKRPIGTIVLQNGEAETAMPFASPLPAPYATHLTSPYFNITDSYNQAILSTKKPLSVIVASPKANGFHGASGLSSYIPWAYDSLLKDWITSLDVDRQVEVREWAKEGWTFHAKGIWIDSSPIHPLNSDSSSSIDGPSSSQISSLSLESLKVSNQETNSDPFKRPSSSSSSPNPAQIPQTSSISEQTISSPRFAITMVGSSNFGTRSTERDLESQLAIFTIDESLSDRLKQEREWIWGQGEAVSNETFNLRSHNHSPLLRILMPFATKYM